MKARVRCFLWVLVGISWLFLCLAPVRLLAKEDEKPFRLVAVDGGAYVEFQHVFRGFALGLERIGLLENGNVPVPADTVSVKPMWEWLRKHAQSRRIVFLPDGYYSADYDAQKMEEITQNIARRIAERHDVDAIVCFGTIAGQAFAKLDIHVPIIFTAVTDAVAAHIVPSVDDSGKDNHVAILVPGIHRRMLEIFHTIFSFTKMGIAYEDSPHGCLTVGIKDIEAAAKDLGIELIRCTDTLVIDDIDLASERLAACHRKLVRDGAQAVFVSNAVSITEKHAKAILQPIVDAKLPNFSQLGSSDVKLGVLMSLGVTNMEEEGAYAAELLQKIMQGRLPRSLPQTFASYVTLAINLGMADHLGWQIPLEILLVADELY